MEGDIARLKLHCATLDARCQALRSCSTAPASAPAAAPAESNTSVKPDVEANTAVMSLVTQAGKQIDDVRKRVHLLGVAAEAADERAMAHEAETAACRAKVAEATNALARLLEERSRLAVDSRANQAALAAAKFETGSLAAHMDKLKQVLLAGAFWALTHLHTLGCGGTQDLIESHRQRVALEDELEKAKVAMARAMAPVLSPIAKPRALRNDDAHEEV